MATDVLPDEKSFAKDMGLWSLALVMPQVRRLTADRAHPHA
jgi:hypothetical protein